MFFVQSASLACAVQNTKEPILVVPAGARRPARARRSAALATTVGTSGSCLGTRVLASPTDGWARAICNRRSRRSLALNSKPLNPGICTSVMRHDVSLTFNQPRWRTGENFRGLPALWSGFNETPQQMVNRRLSFCTVRLSTRAPTLPAKKSPDGRGALIRRPSTAQTSCRSSSRPNSSLRSTSAPPAPSASPCLRRCWRERTR
jgi:hypothetical protein